MRGRLDLFYDILSSAKSAKIPTHIIYATKMNNSVFYKYAEELIQKGLLHVEKENRNIRPGRQGRNLSKNPRTFVKRRYQTTQKGLDFTETYEKLMELLE